MVKNFTLETFDELVGKTFDACPSREGAKKSKLVLTHAEETVHDAPSEHRDPFSLTFHAKGHDHEDQQLWKLKHRKLGEFEIFLVPHGGNSHGVVYGAHFN